MNAPFLDWEYVDIKLYLTPFYYASLDISSNKERYVASSRLSDFWSLNVAFFKPSDPV